MNDLDLHQMAISTGPIEVHHVHRHEGANDCDVLFDKEKLYEVGLQIPPRSKYTLFLAPKAILVP